MGLEIVWIRLYTRYLSTTVYAFAGILGIYLLANFAGAAIYRWWSTRRPLPALGLPLLILAVSSSYIMVCTDPFASFGGDSGMAKFSRLLFGVSPFSLTMGFLVSWLMDRISRGSPQVAGRAYAVNIIGCILGPLLAGFVLLPLVGERGAVILLTAPFLLFALWPMPDDQSLPDRLKAWKGLIIAGTAAICILMILTSTTPYEFYSFDNEEVVTERDFEATTLGVTLKDGSKRLLVNGVGMTALTPTTKYMAHLPLAMLPRPPQSCLVICFGMGTTFRAATTWGIPVDSVDLVPGVPKMFGCYFPDAAAVLQRPGARIYIDDGRRFLARTTGSYDLIVIDPPPPVESAASGLLYSTEFYEAAKSRLKEDGILQQWFPGSTDPHVLASITLAVVKSFPYVRTFPSIDGWGVHILASATPLAAKSAAELAAACPPDALRDMLEWRPDTSAERQFQEIIQMEVSPGELIRKSPLPMVLTDQRPFNEYDFIRHRFPAFWLSFFRRFVGPDPAFRP